MKSKKIIIVILLVLCICSAGILLFHTVPEKAEQAETLPAIMINVQTKEAKKTELVLEGEWSTPKIGKAYYRGKIEVKDLAFTDYEDKWEHEIEFPKNDLQEFFGYSRSGAHPGHSWFETDKEHGIFYFETGESNGGVDYIIIAPAENEQEAKEISNKVGLTYPG